VVLRSERLQKANVEDSAWVMETTWTYYDKSRFRVYRQVDRGDETTAAELIDEGQHGLAKLNRVPLVELRIHEGLWLMRKAAQVQLEHFNKSNALAWA